MRYDPHPSEQDSMGSQHAQLRLDMAQQREQSQHAYLARRRDSRARQRLLGGIYIRAAREIPPIQTEATTRPPVPPSRAQTATADNGGIAINADGNANVSVHQTKP